MKRIILLSMMILGTIAALSLAPCSLAQGSTKPADVSGCQKECDTCATTCENTLSHCQKLGGKHTEAKHVNSLKDCISTCKLSKDFMSRKSDLQNKSCGLCEEACSKCADSCESFKGDKSMKDCADECRKCAAACKKMAG